MAPLPPHEYRHPFLRYQGLEYTDADIADFEERLERIYSREIHRVQVVDFRGMPELMRDSLVARMVMKHHDYAGVILFTSRAWGRLFDNRGPLVWELILEFLSMLRFGEVLFDLDAPARLAEHFGLLTDKRLRGLTVIMRELPIIDMAELVRLRICVEIDDTWAWIALGTKRQPDAAAGAPGAAEDAPIIDEDDQAVLGPYRHHRHHQLLPGLFHRGWLD
ncbi:hypothetical protein Tco_1470092 [Tanacetum coccineum]